MFDLTGKVVVCTGSGRPDGLGAAILTRMAQEGCRVVVSDLGNAEGELSDVHVGQTEEMKAVVASLEAQGADAIAVPCDVRNETAVQNLINTTVDHFGRLDVMINNAGVGFLMEPLLETTAERWRLVMDVNLTGAFLCTQAAGRQMREQGDGGRVINIASQAAKSAFRHMAAYVSSKHGMIGLTRTSALELAEHQITVNAICPNHVRTGLGKKQNEYFAKYRGVTVEDYRKALAQRIPLGRPGFPEDTAAMAAFLASDQAVYITGEAINVSGGEEMH